MITVCHVLDETAGWEQHLAVGYLLDRLPADRFNQVLAAAAGSLPAGFGTGRLTYRIPPAGLSVLRAALLNRFLSRKGVDVVHAWGPHAAESAASSVRPIVLEIFDPQVAQEHATFLRTLAEGSRVSIACAAELVRRRLIEAGVELDHCPVIRPGVDFQRINRLRRRPLREALGIARENRVIIIPPAKSADGGAFEAFWTAALLNHLDGNVRLVIPGNTRESRRIARFAAALPTENALVRSDLPFEELLVHADVLVAGGHEDASTTAIAWAMAGGVPVIAAATRANAELIAHKVGGLLYKPSREGSDAPALVRLLKDQAAQLKAKEVASGQAYEVFGLRRYVEQHAKLYDNLLKGKPASHGIEDPAKSPAASL